MQIQETFSSVYSAVSPVRLEAFKAAFVLSEFVYFKGHLINKQDNTHHTETSQEGIHYPKSCGTV